MADLPTESLAGGVKLPRPFVGTRLVVPYKIAACTRKQVWVLQLLIATDSSQSVSRQKLFPI